MIPLTLDARILAPVCMFAVALPVSAPAQTDTTRTRTESGIIHLVEHVLQPGDGSFVLLPKVTYSSETSLGFGAEVGKLFTWGDGTSRKNSGVRVEGRYTLKRQGDVSGEMVLGWLDEKYTFKTKATFSNIPRRFYGIGPDTPFANEEIYQRQSVLSYVEGFRRVTRHLRVGLRAEVENSRMLQMREGGALNAGLVPGTDARSIVGGGLLVAYDTRDNPLQPRHGSYHQAFLLSFVPTGGEGLEFTVFNADLRWYVPVRQRGVLALQAFTYGNRGEPPFWRMAGVGGRAHSRGYRFGRYLDQVMAAVQAEYRFPIWWRAYGAAFAGVAEAVPDLRDTAASYWHPTVGAGLRLDLGSIRVRADGAYGNVIRGYLSIGDAF